MKRTDSERLAVLETEIKATNDSVKCLQEDNKEQTKILMELKEGMAAFTEWAEFKDNKDKEQDEAIADNAKKFSQAKTWLLGTLAASLLGLAVWGIKKALESGIN